VGDIEGNYKKIARHVKNAEDLYTDIVVFPELAITGYPPEDLVLKPAFIDKNIRYLSKIKDIATKTTVITGFVNRDSEIYNSAAIINNGKIVSIYNKQFLPNYSVFDEERYFQKGSDNFVYDLNGTLFGINICEDIYYSSGPIQFQSIKFGAKLIINISASPYHTGKIEEREKLLFTRAIDNRVNILYVNLVGGQDELVFDGTSMLVNEKGQILCRAKSFEEDHFIYDIDIEKVNFSRLQDAKYKKQRDRLKKETGSARVIKLKDTKKPGKNKKILKLKKNKISLSCCIEEEIFKAVVLGTRDYIIKNGFNRVVIGLSGGIDSALTAVIAAKAIKKENVYGVIMPSMYSTQASIDDSVALAKNIGIKTLTVPINDIYNRYIEILKNLLKTDSINVTKENLQARIRGNILMGLSNEYGWLVLATGNKSEVSVGYCTLYGDMVGGFSPIKDLYKTIVYRISDFLNEKYNGIIPIEIIKKAPSAELKPDQKDQDSLPPYDVLDDVLKAYIEEEKDYKEIVKSGFDIKTVKEVINMVDFNEYKRRQGAPGIKITARAFGRDRRYPITNKFKL
jgi:NAD+ synthase (glutamine-hydrolysing)